MSEYLDIDHKPSVSVRHSKLGIIWTVINPSLCVSNTSVRHQQLYSNFNFRYLLPSFSERSGASENFDIFCLFVGTGTNHTRHTEYMGAICHWLRKHWDLWQHWSGVGVNKFTRWPRCVMEILILRSKWTNWIHWHCLLHVPSVALSVQTFYAYRIYILSKNKVTVCVIMLVSMWSPQCNGLLDDWTCIHRRRWLPIQAH